MWKVGFSFRQRGIPDGHTVISTQTGGAGSVIFTNHPSRADRGEATDGSAVFHIDDLGAAPEPQFTIGLVRGNYSYGLDETTLRLVGVVTHTNDDRCQAGAKVSVTLYQRHNPSHPDRISLRGQQAAYPPCAVDESWGSTDKRRVSVTIGVPRHIG